MTEITYTHQSISSAKQAQIFADIKAGKFAAPFIYEGTLTGHFNWRIRKGHPVKILNTKKGLINEILQVVGVEHIISPDESTTTVQVGLVETLLDVSKYLKDNKYEILELDMFIPSEDFPNCPFSSIEDISLSEDWGIAFGAEDFGAGQGSGTKEIDLNWTKGSQNFDPLTDDVLDFLTYRMYFKAGMVLPTPTDNDGHLDKDDYADFGDIDTESRTVTMPLANTLYGVLFVMVVETYGEEQLIWSGTAFATSGV